MTFKCAEEEEATAGGTDCLSQLCFLWDTNIVVLIFKALEDLKTTHLQQLKAVMMLVRRSPDLTLLTDLEANISNQQHTTGN